MMLLEGRLDACYRLCRNTKQKLEQSGKSIHAGAGYVHDILGAVYLLRADWNRAERELKTGMQRARLTSENNALQIAHYLMMQLKLALGDVVGARKELENAVCLADSVEHTTRLTWFQLYQMLIDLAQGNALIGQKWILRQRPFEISLSYLVEEANLARAWIMIQTNETSAAREIIDPYLDPSLDHGRLTLSRAYPYAIAWQTLKAIVLAAHGKTEQACTILEDAIEHAMPERILLYFHFYADRLRSLLDGIKNDKARAFLYPIVEDPLDLRSPLLRTSHRTVEPLRPRYSLYAKMEGLSDREQQVLDFIALGMSNRQISKRLSVSEGTVKVHTHNLFGKLGVKNRIQATNQARRLGIIKD